MGSDHCGIGGIWPGIRRTDLRWSYLGEDALKEFRGDLVWVAGVEWWLGVVFDCQLDHFGPFAPTDFSGQPECEVDAGRDTCCGDQFAVANDAVVGP